MVLQLLVNENGKIFNRLPFFEEAVETYSFENIKSGSVVKQSTKTDPIPLIHKALVTGLRDYFTKTGLKSSIIGLSGGIDSAICLCLAVEALGNENVQSIAYAIAILIRSFGKRCCYLPDPSVFIMI